MTPNAAPRVRGLTGDYFVGRLGMLALKFLSLSRMPFGVHPSPRAALLRLSAWCSATAADLTEGRPPRFYDDGLLERLTTEQHAELGAELLAEGRRLRKFLQTHNQTRKTDDDHEDRTSHPDAHP